MSEITNKFWVRGVSFRAWEIKDGELTIGHPVRLCPQMNEHQAKRYPGTLAFAVEAAPFGPYDLGLQLGWFPGELCFWLMHHKPENITISDTAVEDGLVVGVEVSFTSDEVMPRQKSTGV